MISLCSVAQLFRLYDDGNWKPFPPFSAKLAGNGKPFPLYRRKLKTVSAVLCRTRRKRKTVSALHTETENEFAHKVHLPCGLAVICVRIMLDHQADIIWSPISLITSSSSPRASGVTLPIRRNLRVTQTLLGRRRWILMSTKRFASSFWRRKVKNSFLHVFFVPRVESHGAIQKCGSCTYFAHWVECWCPCVLLCKKQRRPDRV